MNFRAIQKILSDCAFHPNKPGPMKVIVDVGSPDYYLNRAVEMIRESQNPTLQPSEKWTLRQRAISLLAINILREQDISVKGIGGQSKSKKGRKDVEKVHQAEPKASDNAVVNPVEAGGSGSVGDRTRGSQDPKVGVQAEGSEQVDDGPLEH
jgi:hypothetical protein